VATVEYEGVTKRFGSTVAVDDFSLSIGDGEFVVLVGPSGSGKTTALRILAGLESLSEGRVRIDGREVNDVSPKHRDVAMVFQDYALYPQMTVRQNLAFSMRIRKVPAEDIRRRVEETAGMLGLDDLLGRKPRELSGGQRQRVALGRALVREPKVFLMDEPLSNLDAQLRTQTRGEIKRLQQQVGITTVYVTHDQVEAMTMGDRIVVMNRGVIEQIGDPASVYNEPANVFVAGFIGSPPMTFATFSSRSDDGRLRLSRGEAAFEVDGPDVPAEVIVGVRPEHARLWEEDGGGLVGPLQGTVQFAENIGREEFVGVEIAPETRFVVEVAAGDVALGETVRFGFRPDTIHLFDPETRRLLRKA